MIVVSVNLLSAISRTRDTELARMVIANDGEGTLRHRHYDARTLKGRNTVSLDLGQPIRETHVSNWPSETVHVWNLVATALTQMGYGPPPKGWHDQIAAQEWAADAEPAEEPADPWTAL